MRLAILSDTHSREATVRKALDLVRARAADCILHCGDIEDASCVFLFPEGTQFVFGNCDWDKGAIRQAVDAIGGTLHENFGHLDLEGTRLAFVHGHDGTLLRDLIASEAYDFLFHGHTHVIRDEMVGTTRVINPGALHRAARKTFALLDLPAGQVEWVVVE